MSKNIEININTGSNAYEALYPKTLAENIIAGSFSGSFNFSTPPTCSVNPSSSNQLARKTYVDGIVSGYATQSWVTGRNYATQSWVNTQLKNAGSCFVEAIRWNGTGIKSHTKVFPSHSGYRICTVILSGSSGNSDNSVYEATINFPTANTPNGSAIKVIGKSKSITINLDQFFSLSGTTLTFDALQDSYGDTFSHMNYNGMSFSAVAIFCPV